MNQPVNQIDYTRKILLPAPTLGGMDFVPEELIEGTKACAEQWTRIHTNNIS
jgi:hypothetical protein